MRPYRAVLDTNVIFAALDSSRGASRELLNLLALDAFEAHVSGALFDEYWNVLFRHLDRFKLSAEEIDEFLDGLCLLMVAQEVYFTWRPTLRDPKDDQVLECAVAANADFIVTFNGRDFAGAETFQPRIATPAEFLQILSTTGNSL